MTWHLTIAIFAVVLSVIASAHAVLYKRDTRAAIAWVGFVWLVPLGGAVLYFIFGVNRIRRHAVTLRGDMERYQAHAIETALMSKPISERLGPGAEPFEESCRRLPAAGGCLSYGASGFSNPSHCGTAFMGRYIFCSSSG